MNRDSIDSETKRNAKSSDDCKSMGSFRGIMAVRAAYSTLTAYLNCIILITTIITV